MPEYHKPVLANETITLLDVKEGGIYVDCTLGGGGHGAEVVGRIGPGGLLVGIDRDPEALEYARERFKDYGDRVRFLKGDFRDIAGLLRSENIDRVDGVIFDFGVSSHQLDAERGFSFMRDEPLDMRMDPQSDEPSAADIVNGYSEFDLADVIWKYGEERFSRRIARAIVERRASGPITRTGELVDVITAAVGMKYKGQDIHPATRTFQGIRIEVNHELDAIRMAVPAAVNVLKVGGRICCISFHSLEDRIVKEAFRKLSGRCECPPRMPECRCGARELVRVITRKPVTPSAEEIAVNVRSRSSKLRCAERISED